MVTTRTPISRGTKIKITREAVEVFKRIRATPMQFYADAALSDALGLLPWQMVIDPDDDVFPGYEWRDQGIKLFRELATLADGRLISTPGGSVGFHANRRYFLVFDGTKTLCVLLDRFYGTALRSGS